MSYPPSNKGKADKAWNVYTKALSRCTKAERMHRVAQAEVIEALGKYKEAALGMEE